ncbi:MAG: penicillin acylase family protein [Candidatus Thorarchaeota archaeon]|jgi:penicillin amidase
MKRKVVNLVLSLIGPIALIVILTMPIGPLAGGLGIIQPIGGIFDNGGVINEPGAQQIALTGLDAEVEVIIDHMGIPHIYAETSKDAMTALGYMHAKDRLFQLTMQKYLPAGRVSEIVGAYANISDMFYRTIGLERAAQRTMEWYQANAATNSDVALALEGLNAEVDGINAFIRSLTPATTPIEFKLLGYSPEPWTLLDSFTAAKILTWGLSGGIFDLLWLWMRNTINNDTLFEDTFPDVLPYMIPIVQEQVNLSIIDYPLAPGMLPATPDPSTLPFVEMVEAAEIPMETLEAVLQTFSDVPGILGEGDFIGSNNWAVNGSKSSTGMPIVAGDPHLGHQAPSVWYEAHIVVPEIVDITGTTFPGLPAVLIGHNEHIAYSFTNVGADVTDIFVEQLNPANASQYMYNGEYRDFEIIDETIHTKEGTDIPFTVKRSVHGPLIDSVTSTYGLGSDTQPNLAMNWTGNGVTTEIIAATLLMQANNLNQYLDAMYWWDSPPQNCVYGDTDGNIGIFIVGRFPIRSGYTGEYPITALNDSVGMVSNIPYAYNPREINPSRGFVQSANQRGILPSNYGFDILGPFADGYRGRRIYNLLDTDPSVTVDDMKKYQADSVEVRAEEIVPFIVDAWDASTDSNLTVDEAVEQLRVWDYDMDPELEAPTIWMYLLSAISYETFDELWTIDSALQLSRVPVLEQLIRENDPYYFDDHTTTGVVETRDDILVRALYRGLDKLELDWAAEDDWVYGNRHVVYIDHLGSLAVIGNVPQRGQNTLNVAPGWRVQHGPSTRLIADLSNIQESYMAYPGGQSGNMFSPHWDDNFDLWYAFDPDTEQYGYHLMYFYKTAEEFRTADSTGTLIERTITFVP